MDDFESLFARAEEIALSARRSPRQVVTAVATAPTPSCTIHDLSDGSRAPAAERWNPRTLLVLGAVCILFAFVAFGTFHR